MSPSQIISNTPVPVSILVAAVVVVAVCFFVSFVFLSFFAIPKTDEKEPRKREEEFHFAAAYGRYLFFLKVNVLLLNRTCFSNYKQLLVIVVIRYRFRFVASLSNLILLSFPKVYILFPSSYSLFPNSVMYKNDNDDDDDDDGRKCSMCCFYDMELTQDDKKQTNC